MNTMVNICKGMMWKQKEREWCRYNMYIPSQIIKVLMFDLHREFDWLIKLTAQMSFHCGPREVSL